MFVGPPPLEDTTREVSMMFVGPPPLEDTTRESCDASSVLPRWIDDNCNTDNWNTEKCVRIPASASWARD
jgi:hypothetical protein